MKTLLLCIACLLVAGCNVNSRDDYAFTARQLTVATNTATLAVPILKASGDTSAIYSLDVAVHAGHNCSVQWYKWLMKVDPNDTNLPPCIVECVETAIIDILLLDKEAGLDTSKAKQVAAIKDVSNEQMELIKIGLDNAVLRFDAVMDAILKPEGAK